MTPGRALARALRALPLTALCTSFAACGAATEPLVPDVTGGDLPTCQQARLDAPDASQACAAAAQVLFCKDPSGADEVCISNGSTCAGAGSGCKTQCPGGGQYAVACDGKLGRAIEPPSGCQAIAGSPSSSVYYCCPCIP